MDQMRLAGATFANIYTSYMRGFLRACLRKRIAVISPSSVYGTEIRRRVSHNAPSAAAGNEWKTMKTSGRNRLDHSIVISCWESGVQLIFSKEQAGTDGHRVAGRDDTQIL